MKPILYTGLSVPSDGKSYLHCPLIKISPRPIFPVSNWEFTHLILTSQTAAELFFKHHPDCALLIAIAVGKATASKIPLPDILIADQETAEGVVDLLKTLKIGKVLWPRSGQARSVITDYLDANKIPYDAPIYYDTLTNHPRPLPPLSAVDEIVFTSPSTVKSFVENYGSLPLDKILTPIGPITQKMLETYGFCKFRT